MEWWGTVLISIVTAIIGGVFGLLIEKSKQKHQDKIRQSEKLEQADKEKPRFEVAEYKGFSLATNREQGAADISVLLLGIVGFKDKDGRAFFKYDKKSLNNENLVYVEYLFINTGSTEIEEIAVSGNIPRFMSVIDLRQKDTYIRNGFLNYLVWSDTKYIKPKKSFRMRVYYVKDQVPQTFLGCPELTIWLKDINGFVWSQLLSSPSEEIEISRLSRNSDLHEADNVSKAIECFRDPMLW